MAALLTFALTLLCCGLLVSTQHWHGRFSLDGLVGIQKQHAVPTPRIGGVAIMAGLAGGWAASGHETRALLGPMLMASLVAFGFGLAEDVTKRVSVLTRLLATMASGVLAWYLTGVAMQDTGFAPLDWVLRYLPAAVLFTAFAVGGVANAVNIIDGFNGLAAGTVAIMLGAMAFIAHRLGDSPLAGVCLVIAGSALGFGVINWPRGKLFMGDGGAYLLGFLVAWVAVLLPMRSASVNAWATILVCAYPVLEVGFSVARRRRREGHHPGQPDRAHLHHFIHRRVVRRLFPGASRSLQNGLTSPFCWAFAALPTLWACIFAEHTVMLAIGLAIATFGYGALYARLTQFRWCFSPLTLRHGNPSAARP